jgi:hypothetical protein
MARIDENQEAIARIRMAVDNYDKAMQKQQPADDEVPDKSEYLQFTSGQRLWALGALSQTTIAKSLENDTYMRHPDMLLRHLDCKLKAFLQKHVSAGCISDDDELKVRNICDRGPSSNDLNPIGAVI